MKDYALLMRFDDLGTDNAIEEHLRIIDKKGYTWAGWWAKSNENLPTGRVGRMNDIARQNGFTLLLCNSSSKAVFETRVEEFAWDEAGKSLMASPEPKSTPSYYADSKLYLWFKISKIEKPCYHDVLINQYAYADLAEFKVPKDSAYSYYNSTVVRSIDQLIHQDRTLILLRKKNQTDGMISDGDELIRIRKSNFPDTFAQTSSNSILLLSDLHFSNNSKFFSFSDCMGHNVYQKQTLSDAIYESTNGMRFAAMICAGDLTWYADSEEFKKAESFFFAASNNHRINKDNIIVVPGNHDFRFADHQADTDGKKEPIQYITSVAKEEYCKLYKKLYKTEPNPYFAIGRRVMLKNNLPVEIVGLNSNCLQQVKGHFTGMGFVGREQLEMVEEKMGWDTTNNTNYAYRILVLHHHLLPVEPIKEPEEDYAYSICLDSGLITSFILRNHINLVIHGHEHKMNFIQVGGVSDSDEFRFNLLGLGSASCSSRANDELNSICTLNFDELGKVKVEVHSVSDVKNKPSNIIYKRSLSIY